MMWDFRKHTELGFWEIITLYYYNKTVYGYRPYDSTRQISCVYSLFGIQKKVYVIILMIWA